MTFGTEKRYISTLRTARAGRIMSGLEVLERKSNSGEAASAIEVVLKHSGVENRIIGSPETVLRELLSYFSKIYPSIELVSKLVLSVDSLEFLQSCTGVLAVSPECLVVLKDLKELKDKELMMIHLAGSRLRHQMGKKESDILSLDEITKTTGRSTGTVAGRLSELCNEQLIERVGKGSYRLTTMGTRVVIKNLMPQMSAENSIAMVLLAARVAHAVGTRPNVEMDPEAISRSIGKAVKTVRNTLAMMTKTGLIDRTSDGSYKLSMQGIRKAHEIAKGLTARAASSPTEKPVTASG